MTHLRNLSIRQEDMVCCRRPGVAWLVRVKSAVGTAGPGGLSLFSGRRRGLGLYKSTQRSVERWRLLGSLVSRFGQWWIILQSAVLEKTCFSQWGCLMRLILPLVSGMMLHAVLWKLSRQDRSVFWGSDEGLHWRLPGHLWCLSWGNTAVYWGMPRLWPQAAELENPVRLEAVRLKNLRAQSVKQAPCSLSPCSWPLRPEGVNAAPSCPRRGRVSGEATISCAGSSGCHGELTPSPW